MQHKEFSAYSRLPILGGVDMLTATYFTHSFSKHFHEGYALGYIEQGALSFNYLRGKHLAPAGSVNLVVPGEAHDGHSPDGMGWSYRMFYFKPELLQQILADPGMRRQGSPNYAPGGIPHFKAGVLHDPFLAHAVKSTHHILGSPEATTLTKESRLTWLMAHWITRHAENNRPWPITGKERTPVIRAKEYVQEYYYKEIPLEDLARVACLSPFHFLRVFEKEIGVPPHTYLLQTRIERAKSLLAGQARLVDIAHDTGFVDQSHFSRLFKRFVGVPPGKFRKIVQNN